jgi:hypothetical protein
MTFAGLAHCAVPELEIHRASPVSLGRVRFWGASAAEQRDRA